MGEQVINRCRLVLSVSPDVVKPNDFGDILSSGDIACILIFAGSASPSDFTDFTMNAVPVIQNQDIAAIVCDQTRLAERSDADGLYLEKEISELDDVIARFSPHKSVGCGGILDRHRALQIGEKNPDFLMFGKLGGDIKPGAHPKNLGIGQWWAEFVEIPGMVMAGSSTQSIVDVAKTGVDFVVAYRAVFDAGHAPREMIVKINALLDEYAPRFEAVNT